MKRRSLDFAFLLFAAALLSGGVAAQKPKGSPKPTFEPGETVHGVAKNGMSWHVRLPKNWDAKAGGPAVLILHGSNMNSDSYVATIAAAWKDVADAFAIVGIDGENRVPNTPDDVKAFNYTYVNWGGRSKHKGTAARESPPMVVEVLDELKESLKFTKILVGGHSQGGFLSYSLFMNFPEVFAGAFPISCGLIVQCEPTAYDDAPTRAAQRRGAIAVVHALDDPVVPYSSGDAAFGSFLDDGFPALKLFAPAKGAHMFALLPVRDAIFWLDEATEDDPAKLAASLRRAVDEKRWRDVYGLSERLARVDSGRKHPGALDAARKAREAAAAREASGVQKLMKSAKDGAWADTFLEFRERFEGTAAAKAPIAAYEARRASDRRAAEKAWGDIRATWRTDEAEARRLSAEFLRLYPASVERRYAKNSIR